MHVSFFESLCAVLNTTKPKHPTKNHLHIMWDWDWFPCIPSSSTINKKSPYSSNPHKNLLPIQFPHENDDAPCIASFKMILSSLFSRRNNNTNSNNTNASSYVKYLCLALFAPLLIPLFFAFFPFVCALELFFRLCRRRWKRKRRRRTAAIMGCGGDGVVGNDEMGNGQRLLQRYLEDQLMLVVGSLYDQCGDDEEEEDEITEADVEYFDSKSPCMITGKN